MAGRMSRQRSSRGTAPRSRRSGICTSSGSRRKPSRASTSRRASAS